VNTTTLSFTYSQWRYFSIWRTR